MDYPTYETLELEQRGPVLTVWLNRPETLNALNAAMEKELIDFFRAVSTDPGTRVVVLSGRGNAFSAGGDYGYIQELIDQPRKAFDGMELAKHLVLSILDCTKPIVARINGHAVGVGATMALFCDVAFAVRDAKIADPHVAIGFVAGDGGAAIWPQLIGYSRAKEFLFTGDAIPAADAARIGLINHAVEADELDDAVNAFADKVASMPARAVQWTKASINIRLRQVAQSILDASLAYEVLSGRTSDHAEAVRARLEKREPKFTGD